MKHAKLQVSFQTFVNWFDSKTREEPLFVRINNELYYVRFHIAPKSSFQNAQISFKGVHESKDMFELDYVDQLHDIIYPSFPEDQPLGSLSIIEVDDMNIELYYYLMNIEFEKDIDLLLQDAPKSWNVETTLDTLYNIELSKQKPMDEMSVDELIVIFHNLHMTVPRIKRELEKYNYYYSNKTIQNHIPILRKQLGVEKVPYRNKTPKNCKFL